MYISGNFRCNIYWLLACYAPRSEGDECIFFSKLSLNIILNFMEWNLTDSREILQTLILKRCFSLVKISWWLASLTVTKLFAEKCRSLPNDKYMHLKVMTVFSQLIQFAYIFVDVKRICSWSIAVNCMKIKPTVLCDIRLKCHEWENQFTPMWCRYSLYFG